MSLNFDEEYFTTNENGCANYFDNGRFYVRAKWLSTLGYNHITVLGCAYGFTVKHLVETFKFTDVVGVDKSAWAVSKAHEMGLTGYVILSDIVSHDYSNTGLIVSWSVLDCLSSESEALSVANHLNSFAKEQIHVISMSDGKGSKYSEWGYLIRPYSYWRSLFPDAYLIDWESDKEYLPSGKDPMGVVISDRRVAI